MKTMSVYGLLGKIYNYNDDLPKRILFRGRIYELNDYNHYVYEEINNPFIPYIDLFAETLNWELDDFLHEQVGIIENDETKEKKLPEKICTNRIINTKDILEFEMIQNKINAEYTYAINWILDYLESEGE